MSLACPCHTVGKTRDIEAGFDLFNERLKSKPVYFIVFAMFFENLIELKVTILHAVAFVFEIHKVFSIKDRLDAYTYFKRRGYLAVVL